MDILHYMNANFIKCACSMHFIYRYNCMALPQLIGYLYKRGVPFGELKKPPRQGPVPQTDPGDGRTL